jgi:LysM repeat protein
MVSAPARPYGQGYGLGRRETAAASAGQYRWNGNPTRIQEGAPPARTTPPAIPVTTADGQRTITVQPGDTLYSLARHHGVSVVALAEANNLMTNSIHAGQRLVLPPAAR